MPLITQMMSLQTVILQVDESVCRKDGKKPFSFMWNGAVNYLSLHSMHHQHRLSLVSLSDRLFKVSFMGFRWRTCNSRHNSSRIKNDSSLVINYCTYFIWNKFLWMSSRRGGRGRKNKVQTLILFCLFSLQTWAVWFTLKCTNENSLRMKHLVNISTPMTSAWL